MLRRQFFIEAMQERLWADREWVIRAFSLTELPFSDVLAEEDRKPYTLVKVKGKREYYCIDPNSDTPQPIDDSDVTEALYRLNDRIVLNPGDLENVKATVETRLGNVLVNCMVFVYAFGGKIPFKTGRLTGKIDNEVSKLLADEPADPSKRDPTKIYPDELMRYNNGLNALGALALLGVPSCTPQALVANPAVLKRRDELLEINKDNLTPATIAGISKELAELDRQGFKDTDAELFFISEKLVNISRQKSKYMYGVEDGLIPEDSTFIVKPLGQGVSLSNLPVINDGIRNASYNRGNQTAMGGTRVKEFYRVFQNTKVAEPDCGSKFGLMWLIEETEFEPLEGRYFVDPVSKKPVLCTKENLKPFMGKILYIRSPMVCKTKGYSYCAICVGDTLALNPDGLHVELSNVGSIFMNTFMKAMHGRVLATQRYDFRKMS